eukprot:gnl/TRDRNA2_/TRDRNA2_92699_c0_seq1.p1 gnl/TRDRNA2_/TRDRNA2_92699_c0~~gnl/TRDRNA2_/TRDRNA2_92699_c0_seq1.p1  ORF type:complete len:102 (-),score=5.09 gnl/TRDRNA2_/TRDRNA2_92699_c0_seq1:63-368(-)
MVEPIADILLHDWRFQHMFVAIQCIRPRLVGEPVLIVKRRVTSEKHDSTALLSKYVMDTTEKLARMALVCLVIRKRTDRVLAWVHGRGLTGIRGHDLPEPA